jgi:putative FmdB family regulatory protein
MPVYEYHCTSCGKDFEYEHRMSDPRKTVCEACGGELERLISRTSFAFKGGGWYKDLYASSKPAAEGGAASSESKPAADSKAADPKPGGGDGGSSGGSAPSTPSTPPASSSGSGGSAAAAS